MNDFNDIKLKMFSEANGGALVGNAKIFFQGAGEHRGVMRSSFSGVLAPTFQRDQHCAELLGGVLIFIPESRLYDWQGITVGAGLSAITDGYLMNPDLWTADFSKYEKRSR